MPASRLPALDAADPPATGSALTPIEAIALADFMRLGVLAAMPVLPPPLALPAGWSWAAPAPGEVATGEAPHQPPRAEALPGPLAGTPAGTLPDPGPEAPAMPTPGPACRDLPGPADAPAPAGAPASVSGAEADCRAEAIAALLPLEAAREAPAADLPGWLRLLLGGGEELLASLGHAMPAPAETPPAQDAPATAPDDGLEAAIALTAAFWGGFRAAVTLTATRDITEWSVALRSDWEIRHVAGATLHPDGAEGWLRLEDEGWNGALRAGQSVTIGLVGATGLEEVADAAAILDAIWLG